MYIVAYVPYEREYSGIHIEKFDTTQELLDCLVNRLDVYAIDEDYEPDENYEQDLETVLDYMDENFVGDGSYGVCEITIMKDDDIIFVGA